MSIIKMSDSCGRRFNASVPISTASAAVEGYRAPVSSYARHGAARIGLTRGPYEEVTKQSRTWLNAPMKGPVLGIKREDYSPSGWNKAPKSAYETVGSRVQAGLPSSQGPLGCCEDDRVPRMLVRSRPGGNDVVKNHDGHVMGVSEDYAPSGWNKAAKSAYESVGSRIQSGLASSQGPLGCCSDRDVPRMLVRSRPGGNDVVKYHGGHVM